MSSQQAKQFHSINISEINTWDDWHLVPTSRPVVNPPSVKSNVIEYVGGDGFLDLTTSLTDEIKYGNRTGSWEFYVINYGQVPSSSPFPSWTVLYTNIMTYIHGKQHTIILDDEPNYYYTGRLSVEQWVSGKGNSTITIGYNLEPFKRKTSSKSEYVKYHSGDSDFNNSNYSESNRIGSTDFFIFKRSDGRTIILEEDMKWVLPNGIEPDNSVIRSALINFSGNNIPAGQWANRVTAAIDDALNKVLPKDNTKL